MKAADKLNAEIMEKGYIFLMSGTVVSGLILMMVCFHIFIKQISKIKPVFPIYATSVIEATSPDMPYSVATFKIVEDAHLSLRIDAMNISMYECYGGGLRMAIDLTIKTANDIPSRHDAAKQIQERWQKYTENQKNGNKIAKNNTEGKRIK